MSAHQGMCPPKKTLKAYFLWRSEVRFADFGTTTAKRQLLRTHYINCVSTIYQYYVSEKDVNMIGEY